MLAITGGAAADTATVTITKSGYVPGAATVAQGGSVQFVNSDTVVHQVVFKTTTGVTCTPNPLVLQAGQSGTCTFQAAGSTTYSDPNAKGNTFRGTVTITAIAEAITLVSAQHRVTFGSLVSLSGVLSNHKAGENVDVVATACGSSAPNKVLTVQTTTNGAFAASVQPLMNTTYTVKSRSAMSAATSITVRPKLRLGKVAAHRFSLRATAAQTFAGKYGSFQRYNGTRWASVRTILLRATSTGVEPTVVTSAGWRSALKPGLRVRAILNQPQVGACYAPGISNTIRS